jgi:hypothetical protein
MSRDEIRKALSSIYEKNGCVDAETVVKAAKPKNSPLHDHFEWNDGEAAHKYRLIQARTMIRSVGVIVRGEKKPLIHVPPEKASGTRRGRYVVDEDLAKDVDEYARALEAAQADLDAALRRMAELRRMKPDDSRFEMAIRSVEAAKLALVA